jgi:hypothetical protein
MFTTTAVVSTIGIASWLKCRTDEIRAAKLVAFLGAILIVVGVTRIGLPEPTPPRSYQRTRPRALSARAVVLRPILAFA